MAKDTKVPPGKDDKNHPDMFPPGHKQRVDPESTTNLSLDDTDSNIHLAPA